MNTITNILAARSQMSVSLAFHIVFASIGIALPAMVVTAELLWLRTKNQGYLRIARAWSRSMAVFFALGAVSGTVLSFELGLLFPGFMRHAGAIIGMPFSLEGFAFFTEAIFLGIYLYGWEKLKPWLHVCSGAIVALSGLASAVFVIMANAWMNAPLGFRFVNGEFIDIDPIKAMLSPFGLHEITHMLIAAYMSTAFAVAAIHAIMLRRNPGATVHRKAIFIALWFAVPCSLIQPLVGHYSGYQVAKYQPMKLAAMEGQFKTEEGAPLRIGGIIDMDEEKVKYAIEIPLGLSILATNSTKGIVHGLEEFPRVDWPHPIVHYSFQIMILVGAILFIAAAWILAGSLIRQASLHAFINDKLSRPAMAKFFLYALVLCGPLGFIAIETGWIVTEVGRQPWIIYNVLRTAETVTPMPGLVFTFVLLTLLYIGLALAATVIILRQLQQFAAMEKAAQNGIQHGTA
ncbi:MAG: cytochrome ubiquinol oxidase subunit I [Bdellovibrionota bacterium]